MSSPHGRVHGVPRGEPPVLARKVSFTVKPSPESCTPRFRAAKNEAAIAGCGSCRVQSSALWSSDTFAGSVFSLGSGFGFFAGGGNAAEGLTGTSASLLLDFSAPVSCAGRLAPVPGLWWLDASPSGLSPVSLAGWYCLRPPRRRREPPLRLLERLRGEDCWVCSSD